MALLIVVAVLIVTGVVWRARVTRRLTIEESVDRYRRTLSAMHDATVRSQDDEATTPAGTPFTPRRGRTLGPPSRRVVAGASGAAVVLVVAAIIATNHGGGADHGGALSPTTTRARSRPTTTTLAAPTTTVPLVRPADLTGTAFIIDRPSYALVLQSTNGDCWVDARDAAGSSLFTGVVSNGTSQSFTASSASIRLGNPGAVKLTVDGAPVAFVTHNGAPVTLHFLGTAA